MADIFPNVYSLCLSLFPQLDQSQHQEYVQKITEYLSRRVSDQIGGDALISPFLTSGVIASVLAMIACTWLTRLYDKIKIFRYTQLLAFVVGGAMYFVQPNSIVLAFTFYIVVTFLTDIQLPIYWASIAESVDYGR